MYNAGEGHFPMLSESVNFGQFFIYNWQAATFD
jgi:hypothetical protein